MFCVRNDAIVMIEWVNLCRVLRRVAETQQVLDRCCYYFRSIIAFGQHLPLLKSFPRCLLSSNSGACSVRGLYLAPARAPALSLPDPLPFGHPRMTCVFLNVPYSCFWAFAYAVPLAWSSLSHGAPLPPANVFGCYKEALFLVPIRFEWPHLYLLDLLVPTITSLPTVLWLFRICLPHWTGCLCPQWTEQVLTQRRFDQ